MIAPSLPPEFTSGNSIPVERATIARERMAEIQITAYQAGFNEALEQVKARIGAMQNREAHEATHPSPPP